MQCVASSVCSVRPLAAAAQRRAAGPSARALAGARPLQPAVRRSVVAAASSQPKDFDELLMAVADKFEKVDNKPVVVGWLVAAFSAIVIAEWFIHLPLFNVLLGWPIQFLGLVVTPYLALRYYVNKDGSPLDDAEFLVNKYSEQLPGLGKK